MRRKKYTQPVLEVKKSLPPADPVFAIVNTEEFLMSVIARIIRLRKQLKEKDGLHIETLAYAQGFLQVAFENLQAWNSRPFPDHIQRDDQGRVFIRGCEVFAPDGGTIIDLICAISVNELITQIDPQTGIAKRD